MKIVVKSAIVFLLLLFFSPSVQSEDALIWDYEGDNFLENLDAKESVISQTKKEFLEAEVTKILDTDVTYATMTDCIFIAAENSYDLKISYHELRNRVWDFRAKTAELLPDIGYTFDLSALSGEFLVGGIVPVRVNEVPIKSSFDLAWDITNKGKTLFQMAELKNLEKAAGYNLDFTLDEVFLNTALGYYDLLGKKLEIDVYRINLQDREAQLRMIQAKYNVGLGSKFDILRAEAEAARAKQEYITLFNTLRYYQARLANVMGVDVITTVYPMEQVIRIQNIIDPTYSVEDLYKIALEKRDDLESKRKQIRAMVMEKREIYADFIPKVVVTAQHASVGTARLGLRTNESLVFEVVQPLGKNLGVNTFMRAKAQDENIKTEKLQLIKMERQVKEDIIQSFYESKTQKEKIESAKKEVIAADESLQFALIRMAVGEATFLDVLQAQSAKTEARQALIQHIVDYNKSQVQMLFNVGCITKNAVLLNYPEPKETIKQ